MTNEITVYPIYYHDDGIVFYSITWHSDVKKFYESTENPGTKSSGYISAERARYILTQGNILSIDETCSAILGNYKSAESIIDDVREALENVDAEEYAKLSAEYEDCE